ncbi:MAG: nucleotide exchange factor GrpE [Acidimicrobiales bacterium]
MTPRPETSGHDRPNGTGGSEKGPANGPGAPQPAAKPDSPGVAGTGAGQEVDTGAGAQEERAPDAEGPEELVASALRERDEYLDMLRRVQADFENYKKRMIRQQTELLDRAAQTLVESLLPALDAFELARAHLSETEELSDEGKALLQASALLFDSLAKEGLEPIDALGKPFDPMTHDAVEHVESAPVFADEPSGASGSGADRGEPEEPEEPEGQGPTGPVVVGVLRPGYRWKGKVIRPAMVRVSG